MNQKTIIYITAGEVPSLKGLHASQILEPAAYVQSLGYKVIWVAIIPLLTFLRDRKKIYPEILKIKNHCDHLGILFHHQFSLWNFNGIFSFPFRKILLRWSATKVAKKIKKLNNSFLILHGRSYYATQVATFMRKNLESELDCVVSFDMRSLAPEEMPITRGFMGYLYYGFYKKWEYELISSSSVAFLPLKTACNRIKCETGLGVVYIPISGFNRSENWKIDFQRRWDKKLAGYSGSFGMYQDVSLLKEMFHFIEGVKPSFATAPIRELESYNSKLYEFSEMFNYYDELLFLIVPGNKVSSNFFENHKMRCNFFSTKAAEALSAGVPLFVSSELTELAEFVRLHNCGLIYNQNTKSLDFPVNYCELDEDFWRDITNNALKAGEIFLRKNVADEYLHHWNLLTEKSGLYGCN